MPPKKRKSPGSSAEKPLRPGSSAAEKPLRGRPPKRGKKVEPEPEPPAKEKYKSFIMKLFDRSVDLAKYSTETALYPVCRAWMVNKPKSDEIVNFNLKTPDVPEVRMPQTTIIEDLDSGKITDINSMPAWKESCETSRFRGNLQKDPNEASIGNFDLNYDLDNPPVSRDDLLAQMKKRSVAVRQNWLQHTRDHEEEKYGPSLRLLKHLYRGDNRD